MSSSTISGLKSSPNLSELLFNVNKKQNGPSSSNAKAITVAKVDSATVTVHSVSISP